MISDIAAWLFTLFVLDPVHAEVRERLERARLPVEAVQQSQQCLSTHGPRLIQQAGEDPVWAVGTAIGVATGLRSPAQLLDINDPNCQILTELLANEGGETLEG
ncbi:hypothetical protein ABID21_003887 [Pseudorhizobium tarimense]|uniref:Uncharacterized protein n=1 Tax=Pseudorhizobium tarimense TaxID=1079109 RepID=A0ABV2HB51_9HYPH|nr:hypothetical protein [Pseudorhizobium tarimense]MCJ8520671.1 hypothetical protein [Pseudorhizobium tarimense]